MRLDRSRLNWGVFFIVLGSVPLAYHRGIVSQATLADAGRLWPLILVGIGLGLVLARTPASFVGGLTVAAIFGLILGSFFTVGPNIGCSGNSNDTRNVSGSGAFNGSADISLTLQCGTATINASPDSQWRIDTATTGGGEARIVSTSSSVVATSRDDGWQWAGGRGRGRGRWNIQIPGNVPTSLSATINGGDATYNISAVALSSANFSLNAGAMHVDLSGARVGSISVSTNAGSTSITLDGNSDVSGSISTNVGATDLCTLSGLELRIRTTDNLAFTSLPGLSRVGNAYQSAGWDTAVHRADLSISTSVGSFNLNPAGGCK